jgi:hypothetical protein
VLSLFWKCGFSLCGPEKHHTRTLSRSSRGPRSVLCLCVAHAAAPQHYCCAFPLHCLWCCVFAAGSIKACPVVSVLCVART